MKTIETSLINIKRYQNDILNDVEDQVAIEEPVEISLSYWSNDKKVKKNVSITMRTPGYDKELAIGFLFTEGILKDSKSVESVYQTSENEICVEVKKDIALDISKLERHFYTSSSCGVCGKSSIDSIRTVYHKPSDSRLFSIDKSILFSMNDQVKKQQATFESTGGLHASALFNKVGNLIELYEDVGRHNALDKLLGASILKANLDLSDHILFLSGRASFELIQKAAMAEIPIVCALGAPSSLAVELANEFDMTLVGFLKSSSFNIYSGSARIK